MKIKCPNCKKLVNYDKKNKYRPFCSERCKMIDLGEWFAEEKVIASPFQTEQDVDAYLEEKSKQEGEDEDF